MQGKFSSSRCGMLSPGNLDSPESNHSDMRISIVYETCAFQSFMGFADMAWHNERCAVGQTVPLRSLGVLLLHSMVLQWELELRKKQSLDGNPTSKAKGEAESIKFCEEQLDARVDPRSES